MRRVVLIIAALCVTMSVLSTAASAHTLITDNSKSKGAILHINPDDDPVAGEPADLYFDAQGGLLTTESAVTLVVTSANGETETETATVDGAIASTTHTFPTQGVYDLVFTVKNGDATYEFRHAQLVSRGVSTSALDNQPPAWAEITLIACAVLGLLLVIMFFNHRRAVAQHSTF